ncbi:MAG TPA: ABC transporter ATP-binding protein, partial [Xanthomonadales bacterium]|nr:ABC transporter ATP-binding protein [Xanthomonadales bacterium]
DALSTASLCKNFGALRVLRDIDFHLPHGCRHALIGPNGSGKTTTLNVISALYRADGGSIRFDGTELIGRPAHAIARLGVARTFQNIRLFGDLSVVENVMIGRHVRTRTGFVGALLPGGATAREERATRERALELLQFVGLEGVGGASARSLPYGDQRRVEIARALASEPRLLLLDEPAAGMNPTETDTLVALLRRIRDQGTTLLLIEHDMNLVMSVSDRITVLNFGQHIAEGPPDEIARNRDVITAYLGGTLDAA